MILNKIENAKNEDEMNAMGLCAFIAACTHVATKYADRELGKDGLEVTCVALEAIADYIDQK